MEFSQALVAVSKPGTQEHATKFVRRYRKYSRPLSFCYTLVTFLNWLLSEASFWQRRLVPEDSCDF
jgi:hypothetical protein